jgi:hypothetical protein
MPQRSRRVQSINLANSRHLPGGYLCGFLLAFHKRKITTSAISTTVNAMLIWAQGTISAIN